MIARCNSSINDSLRYCPTVETPPPNRTSFSPAASFACLRAE
jgi:hypothetical protein